MSDTERDRLIEGDPIVVVDELLRLQELNDRQAVRVEEYYLKAIRLFAERDEALAAVRRVEALCDPAAGMAILPFGNGSRYFAERDIRAALAPHDGDSDE
jgi:hypothetical protein